MNTQIKEQWISALRSGEYEQTKEVLHDRNGFCCLGVLCDLYLKEVGKEWEGNYSDYSFSSDFEDFEDEVLPPEVMTWADLEHENPDVVIEQFDHEIEQYVLKPLPLSDLNDTGKSFKMIAALIEEQL